MLFNSLAFLLFAACFFAGWPLARRWHNVRFIYIILMSFIFYGWWNWAFLPVLLWTAMVDFAAALGIVRHPSRRQMLLLASVAVNVVTLAFFKYAGFFTRIINQVAELLGGGAVVGPVEVFELPVGISFYTFQSMSYTIDVYRGHTQPTRNPLHFLASVCLFPHMVAGPIVRAAHLMPQLAVVPTTTEAARWDGLRLIVHGYFKKVVLADNLAPAVNVAFAASVPAEGAGYWLLVTSMFAVQIYCDFSGYTDIARGLAKWLGYEFTLNFAHPYLATSMREFWERWHISLSTWFRDYVYIPLGGSRQGPLRSHLNLWITMILSGFWHGANWTFLIWGALHAFYLSVERITRWPQRLGQVPGLRWLAIALVLAQVWVGWIFFRARSADQAVQVLGKLTHFTWGAEGLSRFTWFLGLGTVYLLYQGLRREGQRPSRLTPLTEPLALAILLVLSVYLRGPGSAFIYFQF